jgi:hypothetical protein
LVYGCDVFVQRRGCGVAGKPESCAVGGVVTSVELLFLTIVDYLH